MKFLTSFIFIYHFMSVKWRVLPSSAPLPSFLRDRGKLVELLLNANVTSLARFAARWCARFISQLFYPRFHSWLHFSICHACSAVDAEFTRIGIRQRSHTLLFPPCLMEHVAMSLLCGFFLSPSHLGLIMHFSS